MISLSRSAGLVKDADTLRGVLGKQYPAVCRQCSDSPGSKFPVHTCSSCRLRKGSFPHDTSHHRVLQGDHWSHSTDKKTKGHREKTFKIQETTTTDIRSVLTAFYWFCDCVSCVPRWPQTHCVAEVDIDFQPSCLRFPGT